MICIHLMLFHCYKFYNTVNADILGQFLMKRNKALPIPTLPMKVGCFTVEIMNELCSAVEYTWIDDHAVGSNLDPILPIIFLATLRKFPLTTRNLHFLYRQYTDYIFLAQPSKICATQSSTNNPKHQRNRWKHVTYLCNTI